MTNKNRTDSVCKLAAAKLCFFILRPAWKYRDSAVSRAISNEHFEIEKNRGPKDDYNQKKCRVFIVSQINKRQLGN